MQATVPPQATHLSYGMGLPTVAMPAPTIAVAPQHELGFKPHHQRTMKNLSALQIAIGISCVVIYAVLIALRRWNNSYTYLDFIGAGIWCGVLYIIAGSLGVAAARQNRLGLIVSAMVMSILSSLFLWVVIGLAANAVDESVRNENCVPYPYSWYNSYSYPYPCVFYNFSGYKAADSILIILSVAELIISIWCAVLCCKGSCKACCGRCCYGNNYGYQAQAIYYAQANSAGQQIIFAPQAGVAGGHAIAFMPTQPFYMGMQQQQPVLFTHPSAAPGAAAAPPSYQPSVAGPPDYPANQIGNVETGMAANGQPLEVTKERMAEGY